MWTKRNDHPPKSEHADFFLYMPEKKFKFDHACVFSYFHVLFPKTIIKKVFLCHGLLSLSTRTPLLSLLPQNSLNHVSESCML